MNPVPHYRYRQLQAFFHPRAIALIGASDRPGSLGRIFAGKLQSFSRAAGVPVHFVNPGRKPVLGEPSYASVAELPGAGADLAIVVTPAATVPGIVAQCAAAGVGSVIVTSAGFGETGTAAGRALEQALLAACGEHVALWGPNCFGGQNPHTGFDATFAVECALPGSIALIAQSGGQAADFIDLGRARRLGFSFVASIGSMLGAGFPEFVEYAAMEPHTRAIALYLESAGRDPQALVSAIRNASLRVRKPVVVLKPGRTEAGQKAAASHTGAMAANDKVFEAALKASGALRVDTARQMADVIAVLDRYPALVAANPAVISNGGGFVTGVPDVFAACGVALAPLSPALKAGLDAVLPAMWSHGNPVDTIGDADGRRYGNALELIMADPAVDAVIAAFIPVATEIVAPLDMARAMVAARDKYPSKPMVAAIGGGESTAPAVHFLREAGVVVFSCAESAAQAIGLIERNRRHRQHLFDTPSLDIAQDPQTIERVAVQLNGLRNEARTRLSEALAKSVLREYALPVNETVVARTLEEALATAAGRAGRIVMKANLEDAGHKSEAGVHLGLATSAEVTAAYAATERALGPAFAGVAIQDMVVAPAAGMIEMFVGVASDPVFGPVIMVGPGGKDVEVLGGKSLRLVPVNSVSARDMLEESGLLKLFRNRGSKVDEAAVVDYLVRFSRMAQFHWREIREIETNPVLVPRDGAQPVAVDARAVLWDSGAFAHPMALRMYPYWITSHHVMEGDGRHAGTPFVIRPLRPEDETAYVGFQQLLSPETVFLRLMNNVPLTTRMSHEYTGPKCHVDYARELVLGAFLEDQRLVGIARGVKNPLAADAELAFVVADEYQRHGIGSCFLRTLENVYRREGVRVLRATTLARNRPMRSAFRAFGYEEHRGEGGEVDYSLTL